MHRADAIAHADHGRALRRTSYCIFLVTILVMRSLPSEAASPVTIGGPFTLTTATGAVVTDQTYRGKWLLVYFGYTFCPDTCPTALGAIAMALERLGAEADRLQPLFITVDPDRDTPDVMARYVEIFDRRIVGLTGTPQQIATVAKEYGAYYVRRRTGADAGAYVMDHSSYIYLMSPQGRFVRGFDSDAPGEEIADRLRELMHAPK
jgi:protein SCO1